MHKTKRLLIISVLLILAGFIFAIIGISLGGKIGFYTDDSGIYSASSLSKEKNNSHVLKKTKLPSFQNMDLRLDFTHLNIIPSDDYYVEYQTSGFSKKPSYTVDNDTFTFSEKKRSALFMFTTDEDAMYYVNLYVPKDAIFKSTKIATDDGNVSIESLKSDSLNCYIDYGNLSLQTLIASSAEITLSSGDLSFKTIDCDSLKISSEYGNIDGETLSGKEMNFIFSDGDLICNSLTAETLDLSSEYGNVQVNELNALRSTLHVEDGDFTGSLGKVDSLDIKASYGDITLTLPEKLETYQTDLKCDYGRISLPDNEDVDSEDDEVSYRQKGSTKSKLTISCEDGDIDLKH